jgi:hypothetical protein
MCSRIGDRGKVTVALPADQPLRATALIVAATQAEYGPSYPPFSKSCVSAAGFSTKNEGYAYPALTHVSIRAAK